MNQQAPGPNQPAVDLAAVEEPRQRKEPPVAGKPRSLRLALRYGAAAAGVAMGLALYQMATAWIGPGLPPFILFYPLVMVVALLGGLGPGLLATALAVLAVAYWIMPPVADFAIASPVHRLALALFGGMGVLMSIVAELYRRSRPKAAAYEQELALRESRAAAVKLRGDAVAAHREAEKEIAERRRAEQELARLASFPRLNPHPIVEVDLEGRLQYLNPAAERLLHETRQSRGANPWLSELGPAARALRDAPGKSTVREVTDGKKWFLQNMCYVAETQTLRAYGLDITERKEAEAALRHSEKHFRTMADAIPQLAWIANADGWIHWYNRRWYEYTGATPAQMEGWGWQSVHDPAALPRVLAQWRASIATGEPFDMTFPLRGADGVFRQFLTRSLPLKDEQGRVLEWFGTNTDVSEQKKAEEALRELSSRLTYHVDNSPLAVIEWGPDMRLIRWSGTAERIFGWKAEEVLGKKMEDFRWIYTEDQPQVAEVSAELQTGANPRRFSANRNYRKDGSLVHCEWYNSSLVDSSGKLRSILSLVLDVTARNQAQERLQASLQEKEVLLKEVHHRVKNNMQVISSLVSLQAESLDNPALRELFGSVRDQVRTMALVHEKLYHSADLGRVEFAAYARSLLEYLWRAHGAAAANVKLKFDLQPLALSVETAVPCGLILNELAANALKHAFRGRAGGEVTVALHDGPGRRVRLRVSDNGVGLPAGLDWRQARSLGLRLVQMLAGQLNGTVGARVSGGTEFEVVFEQPKA